MTTNSATKPIKSAPDHAAICKQVHRLLNIDCEKVERDSALDVLHDWLDEWMEQEECTLDEAVSAFAKFVLGNDAPRSDTFGVRVYDFEDGTFQVEYTLGGSDAIWVTATDVLCEAKVMRHRRRRVPEQWVDRDWMLVSDGYGNYLNRQMRDEREEARAAWR